MKLRFDKNSIRLRLKKSDLEILRKKNSIHETVVFPNGSFIYTLSISKDEKEITARMQEQAAEIIIPSEIGMKWMNNDETGIYTTITFDSHSLDIIIEKDFPCKDKSEEENADTFIQLAEKNQINC